MLQRREDTEWHVAVADFASTEPLNCFSGEFVVDGKTHAGYIASTEPLNCFSGEVCGEEITVEPVRGFNGAAELLQRRGAGLKDLASKELIASTEPLNCFSGEVVDDRGHIQFLSLLQRSR